MPKSQMFMPQMLKKGLIVLLLTSGLGACTDPELEKAELQSRIESQGHKLSSILGNATAGISQGEESLTIQLTFGEDADLDLYVTDPLLETVYFANYNSVSGGRISKDVRCAKSADRENESEQNEGASPRIEEVRFDKPLPGRYRIGIDYSRKCDGAEEQAAFAISVLHKGEQMQKVGSVSFEQFEVVIMEFEI